MDWAPLDASKYRSLEKPFDEAEIKEVIFDCERDKSSRAVGFTSAVFQDYGNGVKEDLVHDLKEFLKNGW